MLALWAAGAAMAAGPPGTAGAQEGTMAHGAGRPAATAAAEATGSPRVRADFGAAAVGLLTRASPAFDGRAFTEGYLTQPVVTGMLSAPALQGLALVATLNLEGLTLRRGELNAGIFGEGYVDRRHPHTLLHELVATAQGTAAAGAARWSLSAGRGFVPFGSDDPMSRPFVKFPANHHFAQILERYVVAGGLAAGPVMVELATFNGDEPTGPYRLPSLARLGDSRAARLTLAPLPWLELSASGAEVTSPEHADGGGVDQRKLHLGARAERGGRGGGGWRYLLAEYARTEERSRGRAGHAYESLLAEGGAGWGAWELALRGERTDRPEELRLLDPFRTPLAHADGTVLGITRWSIATAAVSWRHGMSRGPELRPFAELSYLHAAQREVPSAFDPAGFYGSDRMWSMSAGLRMSWGMRHSRMGRYGVAAAREHGGSAHPGGHAGGSTGSPGQPTAPSGSRHGAIAPRAARP